MTDPVPPVTHFLLRSRGVWQAGLALLFGASTLLVTVREDPGLVDPNAALLRWLPATGVLVVFAALSYAAARPLHDDARRDRRDARIYAVAPVAPVVGLMLAILLLAGRAPPPDAGDAPGVSSDLGPTVRALRYLCLLPAVVYLLATSYAISLRHGTRLDVSLWRVSVTLLVLATLASLPWDSPTVSIDAILLLTTAPTIPVLYRGVLRNHRRSRRSVPAPPTLPPLGPAATRPAPKSKP